MDAFPAEVRRGIDGTLDGQPLRIAKRWLAPIAIVTPEVNCRVSRLGLFGWRLRRTNDDAELASQRRCRITVCDDLKPRPVSLRP